MKKTKLLAPIAILLIVCLLTGCGASSMKYAAYDTAASESYIEEPQAAPMMEEAVAEDSLSDTERFEGQMQEAGNASSVE